MRAAGRLSGAGALAALALALLAGACRSSTTNPAGPSGGLGQPCNQGACNPPYQCDAPSQTCVSPSGSTCGNDQVDAGEQCDGTNLNGRTCVSLGFSGGTLSCAPSCTLDTSACTSPGGNGVPALVQNVSSSTNPVGIGIDGNDFKFAMPNAVLAGNALVLKVAYLHGASFAATPISDSNGNAWPTTPSASLSDSNLNLDLAVFVLPNANPGPTTLTIHFTARIHPVQYDCSEWVNVATSSPLSGTAKASNVATPSVAAGSFAPVNNDSGGGNLIIQYAVDDDDAGGGGAITGFAAGPGFTLLDADIAWAGDTNSYHASQFSVQATAAPVNPTLTASGGPQHFATLAIALRAAPAGTAPPASGIRIVKVHHFTNEIPPTSWSMQMPTTGSNLIVAVTANAPADANTTITGVTDNRGNTYAKTEPADDQPQWWIAQNAATGDDLRLTFSLHSGAAGCSMRIFEITGAATSGQPDTSAGHTLACSGATSVTGFPVITPASANGLTIATMAIGQGPGLAVTSPAGATWGLVTYTGEQDTDTMENADAQGWLYNSTMATESWNWDLTSIPNNTCYSSAIHLKGA